MKVKGWKNGKGEEIWMGREIVMISNFVVVLCGKVGFVEFRVKKLV